ncbi:hypothetical protein JCM10908_001661 [Rhodotorula pacifica]|uniref:uncharacterized protein n=1 Tax=Rhodotorula pacifica TaxID=1495444 RepID=UPI003180678F
MENISASAIPLPASPPPAALAPVAQTVPSVAAYAGGPDQSHHPQVATAISTEAVAEPAVIKEVSVGDLEQELEALGAHVSSLASSLGTVFDLRQTAIAQGPAFTLAELERLAQQTTAVGQQLTTLPATFTLTSQRLQRLESLVALDKIAALPSELGTLREQYAAARLEAKQTIVERIRSEAWDEVDARDSAWRRCEERIAAENPALGGDEIRRAVQAAFEGASDGKVADLEIASYAGRVAAENPATELAQILDDHADAFHAAFTDSVGVPLDRQSTRMSTATGTTLVDPSASAALYDKVDDDVDAKSGLRRLPTSATLVPGMQADEELGLLGTAAPPLDHSEPLGKFTKLRRFWRDYLVRTFLLISIVALIAGLTASEQAICSTLRMDFRSE